MSLLNDWKRQYISYNKNVKLFILTNIYTQIGMGIFMVIYNFYIRELGYSEQMNGTIIAMTALASAIILVPAGILSDKMGRKKVMALGVAISAIALFSRSIIDIEELLIATAFLTGLSTAFIQVSGIPWLAENSTPKQRVHLFSFHAAIMMAANVVGNILGGVLSDTFHYVLNFSALTSVRMTLLIAVGIYVAGILPIFKMSEKKRVADNSKTKLSLMESFWINKSQLKLIALFAGAQMIIGFGSGLVIPYLNLYFSDRFHANNSIIGIILSLGQAATAVAMIIGPAVVRKVGEVRAVVYLQLLSLPFLLLTAYTENLYIAGIGFLFRQALMNAGNPIQSSLMMARVDDSMKGLANSVNQMVFQLGWALMGPVSTSIVLIYGSYWGYAYVFTITSILYLIGSLYFYFVFKGLPIVKSNNQVA
ncbi:MFS transporter [Ferdinandcohnia quinoae]|uniref:MFS transporter n=1 Tax=Fredinandcohnia quinoae TaxID=2918902 RepID=A0AAW5DZR9_9BACI|nr:MFS transporter [Fredinandcohnia sp. SECRCQ15]MCH1625573.1 MFS transporter [Fredinandcohnia sp. SECRCQ15]